METKKQISLVLTRNQLEELKKQMSGMNQLTLYLETQDNNQVTWKGITNVNETHIDIQDKEIQLE